MTFEAALYAHLMADVTITDIVGDRIQPFHIKAELDGNNQVLPFIVILLESAEVQSPLDTDPSEVSERWAISACSGRHDEMLSLASVIVSSLHGLTKSSLLGGASGVRSDVCLESYSDDAEYGTSLYVRRLVFTATHEL